jgi:hypothetical protein
VNIFINLTVALDASNLVIKKHGVNGEPVVTRADENGVFALVHCHGSDGGAIFILERFQ